MKAQRTRESEIGKHSPRDKPLVQKSHRAQERHTAGHGHHAPPIAGFALTSLLWLMRALKLLDPAMRALLVYWRGAADAEADIDAVTLEGDTGGDGAIALLPLLLSDPLLVECGGEPLTGTVRSEAVATAPALDPACVLDSAAAAALRLLPIHRSPACFALLSLEIALAAPLAGGGEEAEEPAAAAAGARGVEGVTVARSLHCASATLNRSPFLRSATTAAVSGRNSPTRAFDVARMGRTGFGGMECTTYSAAVASAISLARSGDSSASSSSSSESESESESESSPEPDAEADRSRSCPSLPPAGSTVIRPPVEWASGTDSVRKVEWGKWNDAPLSLSR